MVSPQKSMPFPVFYKKIVRERESAPAPCIQPKYFARNGTFSTVNVRPRR